MSELLTEHAKSLQPSELTAWANGFCHAVWLFSVCKDGEETIGGTHTRQEVYEQLNGEVITARSGSKSDGSAIW